MARQNVDKHNLAAVGGDDLMADNLLAGVVPALHKNARLDLRDQFQRRVLFEDHDQVDRLERGQNFGPRALILHRPLGTLQTPHRRIAVETDDQAVARGARLCHHAHMTRMQNVEAAVGEADAQSLPAPLGKMRIKVRSA